MARANEESVIPRLTRAGADKVVSPVITGSRQMAQMLLKPAVADFMELASMADKLDLELDQIEIGPGSKLSGTSVGDGAIGSTHDVIVIAVQGPGGNVAFNPGSDRTLATGDILIAMGSRDDLMNLRRTADPSGAPWRPGRRSRTARHSRSIRRSRTARHSRSARLFPQRPCLSVRRNRSMPLTA